MSWRKGFVRGLVFLIVAACAATLVWYQHFTNPAAVRQQVLDKFRALFPGAEVSVESARLHILGGIRIGEIRLWRKDDPDRAEIARIPSAILYPDKEKLLDGTLTLRKVELQRPRLKVQRNPDGTWNLQGLAGPSHSAAPLPTIVIQQGTLIFEDQVEGGSGLSLELTDVNLTLINDPVSTLNVEGSAASPVAGKVQFNAQWQRGTGAMTVSLTAQNVPLGAGWSERLACAALAGKLRGLVLEGKAQVKAEISYRPAETSPLSYDVRVQVQEGKLQHPLLPLSLEGLEAVVRLAAGEARVDKLKARSGAALIEGHGLARLPAPDQSWEAHLEVKHLDISDALTARLPEKLRKLQQLFQARGPATVRLDASFSDGGFDVLPSGANSAVAFLPENLSATFEKFPYPLKRITGSVKHDLRALKTDVDLTAFAGERPVSIKGAWEGQGEQSQCRLDIAATEVIIDEKLLNALPAAPQKRVRGFNPTGKVDIKYHLSKEAGGEFRNEYHLRVHGAAARWDLFPYDLEIVSGLIDVYPDNHLEFRDFQASHKNGGKLFLSGRAFPRPDGTPGLVLELAGKQVALDEDLKQGLTGIPGLAKTWDALRPRGRMDFAAVIDRTSPKLEEMDVQLTLQGCTLVPTFFAYPFENCAGNIRYRRNRVEIDRMYARRRDTEVSIVQGTIDLHAGGGFYADLSDLRFRQLQLDEELLPALPPSVRAAVKGLDVRGSLAGKARLVVAQRAEPGAAPDLFWDGQLWFSDLALNAGLEISRAAGTLACRGRFDGRQIQGINGNLILDTATLLQQPFRNVHVSLIVQEDQPQVLLLNLKAPVHGGDVTGQVRLEFGPHLRYDLNLTASRIDLERLGHNLLGPKNQLKGSAMGRLVLSGQGTGVGALEGSASIDVYNGHLLNLPLLLDLLKFLGLRWPDRTAFEEVHAQCAIHGRRVQVGRLELLGSPISLYGKGGFNLDGTGMELDFYPSWARVEQVLPPGIRSVPPAISKNLLIIAMRGQVGGDPGGLKFHKKPLPFLVDPLLQMRDWISGPPAAPPRLGAAPGPRQEE